MRKLTSGIFWLVLVVCALSLAAGSAAATGTKPTVRVMSWQRTGAQENVALRLCATSAGIDRIRIVETGGTTSRSLSFSTSMPAGSCAARNVYWRSGAAAGHGRKTIAVQVQDRLGTWSRAVKSSRAL